MKIRKIDHIALICSDYEKSKYFYTHVLGFEVLREEWREDRASFKLDLGLHGEYVLELFSFPKSPPRASYPEACGLRHLAFEVPDLDDAIVYLHIKGVVTEDIRMDTKRNRRFAFFCDPDKLPIELYEIAR